MATFYSKTLNRLLASKTLTTQDSILVVAGGKTDRDVLAECGFVNAVISNIGDCESAHNYHPYRWESQDAEKLNYPDNSFDWVFVHAGLHHCASPHTALCEMLRVSAKGVAVFESRDSFLNKISVRLGLVPEYELEPSVLSNGKFGGYRNSHIPNYVYRWTEREVKKTTSSFLPFHEHTYQFFYGFTLPVARMSMSPSLIKRNIVKIAKLLLPLLEVLMKRQGNSFAFVISKAGSLMPWLSKDERDEILFNMDYVKGNFVPEKYTPSHKNA